MRHKKKRNTTANGASRNPDQLDYSDDAPLDSKEYQEAIRAHLNEFEDMATTQANGYLPGDSEFHENPPLHAVPKHVPQLASDFTSRQVGTPKNDGKRLAKAGAQPGGGQTAQNKDRIWNTTTNEERERIKEFWLNLGEEERRMLVKVEKEAVLKKMKEQQKHSCSCSVCGRKRTAIEEELEVLYDAYYEELEQYANQQQFPSQTSINSTRQQLPRPPRHGKITEVLHSDDSEGSFDEDEEQDLSEDDLLTDDDLSHDEDDDEEYSDDEYGHEAHAPPEFFKFGNSLTVKGGILTVADDLLKNDGKKFIEMMEQLAERRMQREEEAAMEAREFDEEEDEDDDYDDDEIDSEDYEDDDEEPDAMTEDQRMAEGRRMFQIFAARMFEQRVLTAYREKVAQERQAQLLQELELEDSREKEREAKKAKEKEKKKDKKRQQQLKKEEDKARKEAEKLAEEAAARAEEEAKAEENRKRKEEQRLKREAEKKAAEVERLRKEEEKRKRAAEEKARENKRLDQLAKEKKAREEIQRKEREAKEAMARELKAKKDAARAQRDSEAAKAEAAKATTNTPAGRRVTPPFTNNGPATASPAVPKSHQAKETNSHSQQPSRLYQEASTHPSGARNIPPPASQPQSQMQQQHHRAANPGVISPQQQYPSHQNSFPRAALGHPPSMPVPLPPPGIGSHGPSGGHHDPFGFSSSQTQQSLPLQNSVLSRSNGHAPSQIPPAIQGPPGVFSTAPGMSMSTSPQSRIGTPQGGRFTGTTPFSAFGGLGSGTSSRDEMVHHDVELSFPRRPTHPLDNGIGPIGAIGRPSPARAPSTLPAPIQRPSALASTTKRSGFNTGDVMGSRALLDEDDPVVDGRVTSSIFNSTSSWNAPAVHKEGGFGSAALNGTADDDEPYHPSSSTSSRLSMPNIGLHGQAPFPTAKDRWGTSVGPIGVKNNAVVAPNNAQPEDHRFPNHPQKPVNWGF